MPLGARLRDAMIPELERGSDSLRKLTGVRGSDILLVSDYIAKEH